MRSPDPTPRSATPTSAGRSHRSRRATARRAAPAYCRAQSRVHPPTQTVPEVRKHRAARRSDRSMTGSSASRHVTGPLSRRASAVPGRAASARARAVGPEACPHRFAHRGGQLLAKLDTPLVERVDVPDHRLHEHLVLVPGDQLADRAGPSRGTSIRLLGRLPACTLCATRRSISAGCTLGLQVLLTCSAVWPNANASACAKQLASARSCCG